VYAWIWRHLPFGRAGRLIGSLLLVSLVGALLWYVVFPWAEPLLPFDDVQVTDQSGDPGGGPGPTGDEPTDSSDHDLPYNPTSNNTPPSR
jgi:hypothetical protein